MLLIQGQDNTNGDLNDYSHKCYGFSNFNYGQLTNIDSKPIFDAIPSKVE